MRAVRRALSSMVAGDMRRGLPRVSIQMEGGPELSGPSSPIVR
jgi:hypothetical protein